MRRPPRTRACAWAAAAVLAIAGCATSTSDVITTGTSSGTTGGAGSTATGTGTGTGAGPEETACSTGMPCAAGMTCLNGVCTSGCNTDADCKAGQYCALSNGQVCVDDTLAGCPATPCAPTQVCVEGLCATQPTAQECGAGLFGGDGCMDNELCLSNVVVNGTLDPNPTCYVLPPCEQGHPCTGGAMGALCSAGVIMGKNDLCIPGGCETSADCPTSWKCIPGPSMALYPGIGQCTNGAKGEPCDATSDCQSGLQCFVPVMDQLGTCK